jgi:NADH-quinone oxidoreductase subunit L
VLAGYVGVPAAAGGNNWIEHFLAPSFAPPGIEAESATGLGTPAAAEAGGAAHENAGLERGLMALSSALALGGIAIAWYFFRRRRDAADRLALRFSGVHRLLLNKYYVDELYDAVIVQPINRFSEHSLWRAVDAGLIDGTVNGTGAMVGGASAILRRLQTGSVRAYAFSIFVGVVLILGYYVWR